MTGRIVRWIIGLLRGVLIGVRLSLFTVRQGDVAVVERFGKVRRLLTEPGCYVKWFWPFERAHNFDGRRRHFNPTFTETLTHSGETIIAESYVVWSIDEERLLDFVKSFRGTKVEQGRVFEDHLHQFGIKRLAFAERTLEEALNQTRVKQIAKVNQYRGEGEMKARAIHAKTELDAAAILAEAKGIAEKTRVTGEADAQRILTEAYREDPEFYKFWRSLEAIKNVVSEKATFVLSTRIAFFGALKGPTGFGGRPGAASPTTQPATSAAGGGR